MAPNTAAALAALIPKYLDQRCVRVVTGGVTETTHILQIKFDHIFYTGSTHVGKIIMSAAAKQLTPVTLELGGKSPTIVDETADIDIAAKRIAWGKFLNAGQTCIAPDYVICVGEGVQEKLIASFQAHLGQFYGVTRKEQRDSACYTRIINDAHFDRLNKLLGETKGVVAIGGDRHREDRYIAPTILTDLDWDDAYMQSEIFGPVLPVLAMTSIDEAVEAINARDSPLALYIFSKDQKRIHNIMDTTRSGAVVVNDVFMHIATHGLPFGGVGGSGFGAYNGKKSFDTFIHERSVLWRPAGLDVVNMPRYPPYTPGHGRIMLSALSGDLDRSVSRMGKMTMFAMVVGLVATAYGLSRNDSFPFL